MSIQPLKDQVLVKPTVENEAVRKSGIILPAVKRVSPTEATVLAVGKDVMPSIKVGQKIVFMKFQGEAVPLGGEEGDGLIMKQTAILAILP